MMLAGENLGLITSRLTKGENFAHAQVSRSLVEVICMSSKTSNLKRVYRTSVFCKGLEVSATNSKKFVIKVITVNA